MSSSVIITGASSGIGRAVARRLARWDGSLILAGRSRKRLEETKGQVDNLGGRAAIFLCDLTEPSKVEDLVAYAEAQGPLYGVVLSAGTGSPGPVTDQAAGEWNNVIEVRRSYWIR